MTENLYNTVIKNDYCIGCGACSFMNPAYRIKMDRYGMYKAMKPDEEEGLDDPGLQVCPFSNASENEDVIAENQFKNVDKHNRFIGKYLNNYVGHVKEGEFRSSGSSGGFGKWILNELLQTNEVDYVVQVVAAKESGNLFTFQIFTKNDNVLDGSKSAYYPVTLKDALSFIKENEGRYAITAVPCFSKAIRNICMNDPEMDEKIKYVIGVICGHLKSTGFAESLAWQLKVEPTELAGIEFRGKLEGLKANEKGVFAEKLTGEISRVQSSKKLLGGNWGHGFFKYKACDYCDDVVGETADVSVGDAWIEELMSDHLGNNVIVVRNKKISEIIKEAIQKDRLNFKEVNEKIIVESQAGGLRHRREGLSYRLYMKKKNKEWVPKKRVEASRSLPAFRKKIYKVREEIRDASHTNFYVAKQKNDFHFFEKSMKPYLERLQPTSLEKVRFKFDNLTRRILS